MERSKQLMRKQRVDGNPPRIRNSSAAGEICRNDRRLLGPLGISRINFLGPDIVRTVTTKVETRLIPKIIKYRICSFALWTSFRPSSRRIGTTLHMLLIRWLIWLGRPLIRFGMSTQIRIQ